jgi:hypothetical protein
MTMATIEYEKDRLYCLKCKEQPDHFLEVVSAHIKGVTPEGFVLEPSEELFYVSGYRCPTCDSDAEWGHVLVERTEDV